MHAALHLEHVLHGVHGPGVAPVEVERAAADVLGAHVVRVLLQAEGVHAEQVAVAGHVVVPVRQRLRHAVAQHQRVAEEEIDDVRGLDCDQVARVLDRDRVVELDRALEVAFQPGARGRDVRALARGGAIADAVERLDALPDQRQRALLRGHHGEVGLERVRHRKVRVLGERRVE